VNLGIAVGILALGGGILFVGYINLIYWLPRKTKSFDTTISIQALKASLWLVIFGTIIIALGLLYLIDILPPPDWWNSVLRSSKGT
jgi:Trk-type K+ transport system membrane component